MPRLIACALTGPAFVAELAAAWARGDAVAPIDPRLPVDLRERLLNRLRPSVVIDERGSVERDGTEVRDGDALVVATSGTTDEPKGVVLTHAAVEASARATSERLGVTENDRWLACLPLAHVGGLSVVTRALITGVPLVVHDHFDAEAVMNSGATLVSLVPTTLARVDPTRFRRIVLGGSVPPTSLPANVVTTYGLTETGSGVVYDGVPLDGIEVELRHGGRIALRGPMLLRCYRVDGDDLEALDADGWLLTSDVGEITEQGHLLVHGRIDDVINTGGEKVWPDLVEAALRDHPLVEQVAVAATPDDRWGQAVTAFVVPRDRANPPTVDALRDHTRGSLAAFALPRRVVIVENLPRTAIGKIRRRDLGVPVTSVIPDPDPAENLTHGAEPDR